MDKNVLMIGGSQGIGEAAARNLGKENNLYIASRTEPKNIRATYHEFDVLKEELELSWLPSKLDAFVYLPGSIQLRPFPRLSLQAFRDDMEINFFGLVKVLQAVTPLFSNGASVVFFSTVAARIGMPFHSSISASKGAIEGLAKSLAAENAPDIRFNVIAPSLTSTPLVSSLLSSDRKVSAMAQRHPMKRVGTVDDMANMLEFLISDKSSWITGQVFGVDGGISTLNVR